MLHVAARVGRQQRRTCRSRGRTSCGRPWSGARNTRVSPAAARARHAACRCHACVTTRRASRSTICSLPSRVIWSSRLPSCDELERDREPRQRRHRPTRRRASPPPSRSPARRASVGRRASLSSAIAWVGFVSRSVRACVRRQLVGALRELGRALLRLRALRCGLGARSAFASIALAASPSAR